MDPQTGTRPFLLAKIWAINRTPNEKTIYGQPVNADCEGGKALLAEGLSASFCSKGVPFTAGMNRHRHGMPIQAIDIGLVVTTLERSAIRAKTPGVISKPRDGHDC